MLLIYRHIANAVKESTSLQTLRLTFAPSRAVLRAAGLSPLETNGIDTSSRVIDTRSSGSVMAHARSDSILAKISRLIYKRNMRELSRSISFQAL